MRWLIVAAAGAELARGVSYDNILLAFDLDCKDGGEQTLYKYLNKKIHMSDTLRTRLNGFNLSETKTLGVQTLGEIPRSGRSSHLLTALEQIAKAAYKVSNPRKFRARTGPIIESNELQFLEGIVIVKNPVLGRDLLEYAELLPCLLHPPEPDQLVYSEQLADDDPGGDEDDECQDEPEFGPVIPESVSGETTTAGVTEMAELPELPPEAYQYLDVIDGEVMRRRLAEEKITGNVSLGFFGHNVQKFTLKVPKDSPVDQPYQIASYSGSERTWGAGFNSAWVMLAMEHILASRPREPVMEVTYDEVVKTIAEHYPSPILGLIDTGCYPVPDIINNFWRNPDMLGCTGDAVAGIGGDDGHGFPNACIGYDVADNKADPTTAIFNDHGTAMSGLLIGKGDNGVGSLGACPWCRLMCIKARSERGYMFVTSLINAMNFALAYGAEITSHSYSGRGASQVEHTCHRKIGEAGIFQAGNEGCNLDKLTLKCNAEGPLTPTQYSLSVPSLITVGATNDKGHVARFSNTGSPVKITAPGVLVPTLSTTSASGIMFASGTSVSVPLVAAIGAIIKTKYPQFKPADIIAIITESAIPSPSPGGLGIADAHRALAFAQIYHEEGRDTGTSGSDVPGHSGGLPTLPTAALAVSMYLTLTANF